MSWKMYLAVFYSGLIAGSTAATFAFLILGLVEVTGSHWAF